MKTMTNHLLLSGVFLLSLLAASVSCTKQNLSNDNQKASSIAPEIEIIQERDQKYPWNPDIFESSFLRTRSSAEQPITPNEYAGRTWMLKHFPIESPENSGIKVIDIDSYYEYWNSGLNAVNIGNTNTYQYTFANYDRLLTKSDYSGSFSIDSKFSLFGVKASANLHFDKTFSEETESESKNVFGYYEYRYDGNKYWLILPDEESQRNFIAAQYTTDDFKQALSSFTPQSFVNKFGAYLLTHYLTGGKAIVLYLGHMNRTSSTQSSEDSLRIAMSATYMESGGETSFAFNNAKYQEVESKFEDIQITSSTIGGAPNHNAAAVVSIEHFNIDYSDWAKTLEDYSRHTVTKIYDGGLIPLSDYVLERNLKNMFEQIYKSESVSNKQFVEPVIEVTKSVNGSGAIGIPKKYTVIFTLTTRYGDKLYLAQLRGVSKEDADLFIAEKCTEFKEIFGTKIVYNEGNGMFAAHESISLDIPIDYAKNKYIYFGEDYMSKYTTQSGITYLVYDSPHESNVYVYTVHDDFVKYAYGLYEFINTLPEKELNFTQATSNSKYEFNAL